MRCALFALVCSGCWPRPELPEFADPDSTLVPGVDASIFPPFTDDGIVWACELSVETESGLVEDTFAACFVDREEPEEFIDLWSDLCADEVTATAAGDYACLGACVPTGYACDELDGAGS